MNLVALAMKGMGQSIGSDGGTASAYEIRQDADSHKLRCLCAGEVHFEETGMSGDFH